MKNENIEKLDKHLTWTSIAMIVIFSSILLIGYFVLKSELQNINKRLGKIESSLATNLKKRRITCTFCYV